MERAFRTGLVLEDVQTDRAYLAGSQEIGKRVNVVDAGPSRIDQDDAVFHTGKLIGTEHAYGLLRLGKVHRDEVCKRQNRLHVVVQRYAQLLRATRAAVRVVADKLHTERFGPLRHEPADAAQAENGERLLVQLGADEAVALPFALMHGSIRLRDVARAGQHKRHRMLGRRHEVGSGSIAYDDPALSGGIQVHAVDHHARAPDDAQLLGGFDNVARNLRSRPDNERIVVGDGRYKLLWRHVQPDVDLKPSVAQSLESGVSYLLGHEHFFCCHTNTLPSCRRRFHRLDILPRVQRTRHRI